MRQVNKKMGKVTSHTSNAMQEKMEVLLNYMTKIEKAFTCTR